MNSIELPRLAAIGIVMLLSGCSSQQSIPAAATEETQAVQTPTATAPELSGWAKVFADPSRVISAVNAQGFANSDYHSASFPPPAFISTGTLIDLTDGVESIPNNAGVYVYGEDASLIDEVRFKLNINSPTYVNSAKKAFLDKLDPALKDMGAPAIADLGSMVMSGKTATLELEGGQLTVRRMPAAASNSEQHSLMIIFHRPNITLQD